MGSISHMVAVKSNGTCVATGYNNNKQCDVTGWTDIVQVACGFYFTIGLKSNGTCVAVGWEGNGVFKGVASWTDIVQVSCGFKYVIGLKKDGTCVAVGDNEYNQLNVSSWTDIVQVSCGNSHTIGLKKDGTVVAVGYNGKSQLAVSSWTNIKQVACGNNNTVGLKSDGTVVGCGDNDRGQLEKISTWKDMKQVICGRDDFTMGLKNDGTCVISGYLTNVQGATIWTDIEQISCTDTFAVGLKKDGSCVVTGSSNDTIKTWKSIKTLYSNYLFKLAFPRFLINTNAQYYTIKCGKMQPLDNQILSIDNFKTNGFEDLGLLTQDNTFYEENKQLQNNVCEFDLSSNIAKIEVI